MITSLRAPWVVYLDREPPRYSARGKILAHWARRLYGAGCAFAFILLLLSLILAVLGQEAAFQRGGYIVIFGIIPATTVYLAGCMCRATLNAAAQLTANRG
jgi:hypothetical protein